MRGIEAKDGEVGGATGGSAWRWTRKRHVYQSRMSARMGATLAAMLFISCACTATQAPCLSPADCSNDRECLAHRCLPQGAEPVPLGAARVVVEPTRSAVVREGGAGMDLPTTVTFGGPAPLNQQLLLRFPEAWAHLDVEAAFLLLHPAPDAEPTGPDVSVSVSLAASPWSAGVIGDAPARKSPESRGLARTRPPAPLRIDVTAQLRALEGKPDHGLLVRAEGEAGRGATYLTGADGLAPRLDVYGRPSTRRP